jgi:hypothetical protein
VFVHALPPSRERDTVFFQERFQGTELAVACLVVAQPQEAQPVAVLRERLGQFLFALGLKVAATPCAGDTLLGDRSTQIGDQRVGDFPADSDFRRHAVRHW